MTTAHTTTPAAFTPVLGDDITLGDEVEGFGVVTQIDYDPDFPDTDMTITRADGKQSGIRADLEHQVRVKPAGSVFIPACELRAGDVIRMGTIAAIDPHETYLAIDFKSTRGQHGTAFPPGLMVLVLSRRPVEAEVDVVAELTALAEKWKADAGRIAGRAVDMSNAGDYVHGERLDSEAGQLQRCAVDVRTLLARLQA